MTAWFVFMGGALAFVSAVAILDWLGRRKDRQHERSAR